MTYIVQTFSSDLGVAKDVPIVDGALAHDCLHSGIVCVLVVRNALRIPSMDHDLIPPFMMRAGGIAANDVPKIHCEDPVVDNHCVSFDASDLRIPLQLNGAFSCFRARVPTEREVNECEIVFLTLDSSG